MARAIFTPSIEPTNAPVYQHGYHLGTDVRLAREIAAEKFKARNDHGHSTRTVALMLNGQLFDCFDGTWANPGRMHPND